MNPMAAPERLEVVRQFVNTRDIEAGTDTLADAEAVRSWARAAGLWRPPRADDRDRAARASDRDLPVSDPDLRAADVERPPRPADLDRALRLREALREAAAANHDRTPVPDAALAVLDEVARRARVALSFTPDRAHRLVAQADGVDGALGEIVIRVTEAMTAGTWPRLKVCANDGCRWAYFDSSRAGTGKWCTMRLCGNRAKQQAWRDRRASPAARQRLR